MDCIVQKVQSELKTNGLEQTFQHTPGALTIANIKYLSTF